MRLLKAVATEVQTSCQDNLSDFLWIRVADPTVDELSFIGDLYDFSHLHIEDALSPSQQPKIELSDHSAFLVLKELRYEDSTSAVETGQIAVFAGRGYVVTTRHGDAAHKSARTRLSTQPELLKYGPVSVLYAVTDTCVDGYLSILEQLAHDIEGVEEVVFSDSRDYESEFIYHLKRENLEVRHATAPLYPAAQSLAKDGHPRISSDLGPYFKDIIDHVLRANDMVEYHDQLLMTMLMAANAQQGIQQNQDMRKISSWAAIIAVPTAIAGVYGMNFDNMPELHWKYGYFMVLGTMLSACAVLYFMFKKADWL